jgi:hypothetical protein
MRYVDQFIFKIMGAKLSASGLIWARIAFVFTLVSSLMSYGFGKEMHWVHGAGLALLTWVVALAPDRIHDMHNRGRQKLAVFSAICILPMAMIEFASHAGYAAGFRGKDMAEANVSKIKFNAVTDAAKDEATNLPLWRKQLADLQAQAPWAATVKADALRSELAALKDRMAKEEAGQRGKPKGKGKEFENLQDKALALEQRIATAEQSKNLTDQINAAQRVLDKKREVVAKADHKESALSHQGEFFGFTAALFAGNPLSANGDHANGLMNKGAEYVLILSLAFAFMVGPALAWLFAGTERKGDDEALFGGITGSSMLRNSAGINSSASVFSRSAPTTGTTGDTVTNHTSFMIADDAVAEQIKAMAKQFVAQRKAVA